MCPGFMWRHALDSSQTYRKGSLTGPNRGPVIPAPIGEREREPPQEYPKTVTPPQTHTTPKPPNPAQPKKPQNPQTTQIKFPTKQKTYAYNFDHRRNRSSHTTLIPTAQGADQRMAVTSTTVQPHGIHAESYRSLMAVLLTALCVCLFVCGISIVISGNRDHPVRVQSATAIYLASFRSAITI